MNKGKNCNNIFILVSTRNPKSRINNNKLEIRLAEQELKRMNNELNSKNQNRNKSTTKIKTEFIKPAKPNLVIPAVKTTNRNNTVSITKLTHVKLDRNFNI